MTINWVLLIYELIGGLALFLFGMDVMTKALKDSAGGKLKHFLSKMTSNRWKALLAGTSITAIIQSSSVTTVLAVGFVSAGVMTFQSTLGVILGANIGTTITAQIIAFKVTKIALLLVIIGYLATLVTNKEIYRAYGNIILGLGLIFLGMNFMSDGMLPLRSSDQFLNLMKNISNPGWGIMIGALFTALVQSSSATTGIVIILASQGLVSTQGGISLIIGANIGTCVTAFLSAIGKPRAAMQVAFAHILFKIIGAILWVWFIPQLADITGLITPRDVARQIANAHTIFNVANATLLIGFTTPLARLVNKLLPVSSEDNAGEIMLLDTYYLQNPALAIDLVDKELIKLADKTDCLLKEGLEITLTGSERHLRELRRYDENIDFHQKQILFYLQQIQQLKLSKKESHRIKVQMEMANILEAAADLVSTDMVESAEHRIKHGFNVSEETLKRISSFYLKSIKSINDAFVAYSNHDADLARRVIGRKKTFKRITFQLKEHLVNRLTLMDSNRIAKIRFETDLIELIDRLYALSRRMARLQDK